MHASSRFEPWPKSCSLPACACAHANARVCVYNHRHCMLASRFEFMRNFCIHSQIPCAQIHATFRCTRHVCMRRVYGCEAEKYLAYWSTRLDNDIAACPTCTHVPHARCWNMRSNGNASLQLVEEEIGKGVFELIRERWKEGNSIYVLGDADYMSGERKKSADGGNACVSIAITFPPHRTVLPGDHPNRLKTLLYNYK